jgi:flagellar FliL protein
VRDRILMTIPAKTYAVVNTLDGKLALRDELLGRINELLQSGKISNLYFTEFVVQ